MRDEIFDREYQAGRDALNDGIDRAAARIARFIKTTGRAIRDTGLAIHKFEFDAPWLRTAPRKPINKRTRIA